MLNATFSWATDPKKREIPNKVRRKLLDMESCTPERVLFALVTVEKEKRQSHIGTIINMIQEARPVPKAIVEKLRQMDARKAEEAAPLAAIEKLRSQRPADPARQVMDPRPTPRERTPGRQEE